MPVPSSGAEIRRLGRWMRGLGVDLLHANTLDTFTAIEAAREAGLSSVWSVHESVDVRSYFQRFGPDLVGPALRAFGSPYRVVFASHASRQLYLPLNARHNQEVIPTGLIRGPIDRHCSSYSKREAEAIIGIPPGKKVVTIVGTVCERKGQLDLVRAAVDLLRSGRDDVVFLVVGCRQGLPYLDAVREVASEFPEAIRLEPETDQVFHDYRASDLFVCCSTIESYPRVVLEAMAFGLPIATTTVFGIAEQVVPNVTALTFEPGDSATLGHLIRQLLDDDHRRHRLAEAGRLRLELLTSFEETVEAYEQIYLEAIAAAMPAEDPSAAGLRSVA